MHRNISAGNILKFVSEVDCNPTVLLRTSHNSAHASMDNSSARKYIDGLASGNAHEEVLVAKAKSLQRALDALEISTTCRTVRTDWDTAARPNNYFKHSPESMALVSTTSYYADFSNGTSTEYRRIPVMGDARGQ